MCAGETYNPNGKNASLVIYVRGNTQPGETHITMTPVSRVSMLMASHGSDTLVSPALKTPLTVVMVPVPSASQSFMLVLLVVGSFPAGTLLLEAELHEVKTRGISKGCTFL